jgi:hypothetical protein
MRGFAVYTGEDCVGYAYISSSGHIGPLAVARPEATGPALRTALKRTLEGSSLQVSALLPSTSEAALSFAIEHRMRITFPMMLMSMRDFGNWAQYFPRTREFM